MILILAVAGGVFDPLNLASPADPERAFKLKTAEIKHGRLVRSPLARSSPHVSPLSVSLPFSLSLRVLARACVWVCMFLTLWQGGLLRM